MRKRQVEERRALYPGSFDPVTRGHMDVIERASRLFDRLFVGVVENPSKQALFSLEERVGLLRGEVAHLRNVDVVSFSGLTVDLAARLGARWIVRGLRSPADADGELAMAHTNRHSSSSQVETVLLPASHEVAFIASSLVREIAAGGGRLAALVTPGVEKALRRKFPGRRGRESR